MTVRTSRSISIYVPLIDIITYQLSLLRTSIKNDIIDIDIDVLRITIVVQHLIKTFVLLE